jgi:hypothetical protein
MPGSTGACWFKDESGCLDILPLCPQAETDSANSTAVSMMFKYFTVTSQSKRTRIQSLMLRVLSVESLQSSESLFQNPPSTSINGLRSKPLLLQRCCRRRFINNCFTRLALLFHAKLQRKHFLAQGFPPWRIHQLEHFGKEVFFLFLMMMFGLFL